MSCRGAQPRHRRDPSRPWELFYFGEDGDNDGQELALAPSPLFEEWLSDPEINYFSSDDVGNSNELFNFGSNVLDGGNLGYNNGASLDDDEVRKDDDEVRKIAANGVLSTSFDAVAPEDVFACENKARNFVHFPSSDVAQQHAAVTAAAQLPAAAASSQIAAPKSLLAQAPGFLHHDASVMPKPAVATNGTKFFLAPAAHARQTTCSGLLPIPPPPTDIVTAAFAADANNAVESIEGMAEITGATQPSLPSPLPSALHGSQKVDLLLSLKRKLAESSHSSIGAGGKRKAALSTRQQPAAKKQKQGEIRKAKDRVIDQLTKTDLQNVQCFARCTRENAVRQMDEAGLNGASRG